MYLTGERERAYFGEGCQLICPLTGRLLPQALGEICEDAEWLSVLGAPVYEGLGSSAECIQGWECTDEGGG